MEVVRCFLGLRQKLPMKSMPSIAILFTAAAWAGTAVWLGSNPLVLLNTFGVEQHTPQLLTEFRAFYGGVEFAIAVAMCILWLRRELFAALLVGGLPLALSATCRCVGMTVDEFSWLHTGLAVVEASGALLCFVATWFLETIDKTKLSPEKRRE
jgi:hypothetical protein